MLEIGESVICPKCGEVNSSNFLFCGMCGTMLEPARKASPPSPAPTAASRPAPTSAASSTGTPPLSRVEERKAPPAPTARPIAVQPSPPPKPTPAPAISPPASVPPIGGPSLLGLDQNASDDQPENAFANLASYGDESQSRGTRVLLLFLLLAALGGGYWWTYTNYLKVTDSHKRGSQDVAPTADTGTGSNLKDAAVEHSELPARNVPQNAPPMITPEPPQKPTAAKNIDKNSDAGTAPAPVKHEVTATRLPAQPAEDSGDALFKQGERYLYGRGGTGDCTNALKYLKMASDKQNAKARSAMGTMYATGHCVSRDLPSAYKWFALALRVDPNNSVVERNLSSVWNQMTPPERQLATKSGSQ